MPDLIVALHRGPTHELWEAFYRKWRPRVFYVVLRRARGARDAAADATQEAFFQLVGDDVWRRVGSELEAFDYLSTAALRALARRQYEDDRFVSLEHAAVEEPEGGEPAETVDVKAVLEGLTADERKLATLLAADRALVDIAKSFNITYSAAVVRSHRLKKKLKEIMGL
jgi:DNA-directed RNA polymerase specialized sigma24 family protein